MPVRPTECRMFIFFSVSGELHWTLIAAAAVAV